MKQIPLAHGRGVVIVDDTDFEQASRHGWSLSAGYAQAKIGGQMVKMHRWLLGARADQQVDHINMNPPG